jgi:hypothetical protein
MIVIGKEFQTGCDSQVQVPEVHCTGTSSCLFQVEEFIIRARARIQLSAPPSIPSSRHGWLQRMLHGVEGWEGGRRNFDGPPHIKLSRFVYE